MILAWLSACSADPAGPPVVDQLAWLAALQERRPGLMTQHTGTVRDPAWQALVIRPRYRAELLASDGATYEAIVAREYTAEQRSADAVWAEGLRGALATFVRTDGLSPARHDPQVYVGFEVGPPMYLEPGALVHDYKVFLEVPDFTRALSAKGYAGFGAALAGAGFWGASKIDVRPGKTRFKYNNVIVYAPSIAMARCAEAVGIAWFGRDLAGIGRGIDAVVGRDVVDWHHFLLTGRYAELPATTRDFVEYRTPVAAVDEVCPGA